MFSFCFTRVLKVLDFNYNHLTIVIVLVSKLYSLFIPMGDGSHLADDADKLFTCISGSGNLSQALLFIHLAVVASILFFFVFCFILKCFTMAT